MQLKRLWAEVSACTRFQVTPAIQCTIFTGNVLIHTCSQGDQNVLDCSVCLVIVNNHTGFRAGVTPATRQTATPSAWTVSRSVTKGTTWSSSDTTGESCISVYLQGSIHPIWWRWNAIFKNLAPTQIQWRLWQIKLANKWPVESLEKLKKYGIWTTYLTENLT